jgi:SPP1 gp7 family putative phage head morphogenesis protein
MPTPLPAGFRPGAAEPKDAFDAFERRGLLQPSFRWQDVWQEEHAGAFSVSGVAQRDVLQLFRDELDKALREGRTAADFARAVRPALAAKGWWGDVEITDPATGETRITRFDDRRLRLIFDVNLRQSHAAGRWARIERNKRRQPYVMYRTMRDERVRASHRPWDSLVLPVDHPFWRQHYPPNGWRCRCTAFALSERELRERIADGEPIKREPPPETIIDYVNPRSGEVAQVPAGVDPGFAYNPGQVRLQQLADLQRAALDGAAPELAAELVRNVVRSGNFERFLAAPVADEMQPVAMLRDGARSATVMLPADVVATRRMSVIDAQWIQLAIDAGQRMDEGNVVRYVLRRDGIVFEVVLSAAGGRGLVVTRWRRELEAAS